MRKVKFKAVNGESVTICDQKFTSPKGTIVGSIECILCPFYLKRNLKYKEIFCSSDSKVKNYHSLENIEDKK
jgi:hypothetical protein